MGDSKQLMPDDDGPQHVTLTLLPSEKERMRRAFAATGKDGVDAGKLVRNVLNWAMGEKEKQNADSEENAGVARRI